MAKIDIGTIVLNRVADLDTYVEIPAVQMPQEHNRQGMVKTYAGGFRRAIIMEQHSRSVTVACERVPRRLVETLESWIGEPLLFRDAFEQMFVGVTFRVQRTDDAVIATSVDDRVDQMTMTVQEISYDYGV